MALHNDRLNANFPVASNGHYVPRRDDSPVASANKAPVNGSPSQAGFVRLADNSAADERRNQSPMPALGVGQKAMTDDSVTHTKVDMIAPTVVITGPVSTLTTDSQDGGQDAGSPRSTVQGDFPPKTLTASYTVTASVVQSQFESWDNKKYTTYMVAVKVQPPPNPIGFSNGYQSASRQFGGVQTAYNGRSTNPFLNPSGGSGFTSPHRQNPNGLTSKNAGGGQLVQSWTVSHRYAEFSQLYDVLKKQYPDAALKLPGKRLLRNNFDPVFIEHRRQGLDNFVQALVRDERLLHHERSLEFLQLVYLPLPATRPETPAVATSQLDYRSVTPSPDPSNRMFNFYGRAKPLNGQNMVDKISAVPEANGKSADDINLGPSERKTMTPKDFDFLKVIGKGSFGKVLLARHRAEDKLYAVKVLQKQQIRKNNEVRHIMSERNILLKNVQHPFLVGLHFSFQTPDKLYFVLDYVNGGELFHHLQRERYFSEPRARFYSAEIASALGYLHSLGIIYRDLKPENLLLDSEGHIRLTDFGLCKEGISMQGTTSTFCGTPEYLAPEILRKQPYTSVVDWWCLGAVLYEMLYGLPPFYSRDTAEMYDSILHKPLRLRSNVSETVRDLLEHLLQKDPRFRLGYHADVEEVTAHAFFRPVDWQLLLQKKIRPPYNPNVTSSYDLRHIDPEFTQEPIPNSVVGGVTSHGVRAGRMPGAQHRDGHGDRLAVGVGAMGMPSMEQDNAFLGFTYVSPGLAAGLPTDVSRPEFH
ncbi:serine/threonine-protein kinase Sgk1-like [Paramacrobiotus metropolitanus]|uniref:serine/threonine-protein kinase Sgk1-like n=1 Tax=Paramacrobiotus metropolitanus TaxID=2943436 RepID=UPI002445C120|nr:serine/threonine-protein kinase Sgk1-like [Paramacrobiotus metropolitanus]XP_055337253.1 serine/threonine-protein kinase Sgk1-like [Paramacrobiotus metropolitanus]XP_055337254.1 serine/threonine-protein kinase Sgk1-like [Paramacrobiotus metropolitanus]